MADRFITMLCHTACFMRTGAAACAVGLLVFFGDCLSSRAAVADWLVEEENSKREPLSLSEQAEIIAEAHALYLQAIFEEDEEGPDKALANKRRVLFLDPGITPLAMDVAQHHLRRGETAEAISVLKDTLKVRPRDSSLALALSGIYLRHLNKYPLAEKYALEALKSKPDNSTSYELLWEIYRAAGQNSQIEPLFQRAAKRDSKDPVFWLDLADIRLRDLARSSRQPSDETMRKVVDLVERAIALAEENPEALARGADYLSMCGHLERSNELYQTVLKQRPGIDDIRRKLAAGLVQAGDLDPAVELLQQIVSDNPLSLPAYEQLARIHLERNEFPQALASMKQALLLAPIDPRRHEEVIRLGMMARDWNTALATATEAERRFPYLPGFTLLRAIALSQLGQHASALMAFERTWIAAANSNPELLDSKFFMSYGSAAERAGHYVKAAELLKKSIDLHPEDSAEACNYLGYMWADRGENLIEAEQLIKRALEQDPENGAYIDSLGWVYFKQARYEEALAELLRAERLISKPDPVVLEHIGDAYEKLGKTVQAVQYWRKAMELDPQNTAIAAKLDLNDARIAKQPDSLPPQKND